MAEFGYIPGRSKSRIYLLISSVNGKFGYSLRPRKWLSLAVRFLYTLLGDTWDCKFKIDKHFMSFNRSLVKSAYQKNKCSYFSTKTYVVGTQKNHLNETVLLSTQNTCSN